MEIKEKIKELRWWDILIVTLIMFGKATYDSTVLYLQIRKSGVEAPVSSFNFSEINNYTAFAFQLVLLILAFIYLRFRNFDFSQWEIKLTLKGVILGIVLFIIFSLCLDIYFFISDIIVQISSPQKMMLRLSPLGSTASYYFSSVLYGMLNGFYEEIYFLGICLSVNSRKMKVAFLFSLFVRTIFHTYQGMLSALGIGIIIGTIHYILYKKLKIKNLFPYFLAHAIADVFGVGILGYFFV